MNRFLYVWLIALGIKIVLAVCLPFAADEAYYWVWGHFPQLSYFDHPPMVGWLFWLGRVFDFWGQASRIPGVLLGHCTLLIWNELLKSSLNETSRTAWMIFVLLSPFMGLGSIVMTPDIPLVFFWSLSLLVLLKTLENQSLRWYFGLGAVLGLGFCAKYHMVLFVPIAFFWLIVSRRWREVRWACIPVTIFSGLVFCAPVWFWNYQNDWVSFRFQLDHGLAGRARQWHWPLQYLGGQIALLFPPIFFLALSRRGPRWTHWLHVFGWLPLLFFLMTSFAARVEANWPIIAHPAILSIAFINGQTSRWLKGTMVTWLIAIVIVLSQIIVPWIPEHERKLKTAEFRKYDPLIEPTRELSPLFASSYQMAATLSYKQKRTVAKLVGMNRKDFYDFQSMSFPDNNLFYVVRETGQPLPSWVADKGYETKLWREITSTLLVIEVRRGAKNVGP